MRIHLIAALAENHVIGRNGGMPWRIPEDLRRFKAITLGHPVIMGRKTWDTLGQPLPGRTNIVVTRDEAFRAEGAQVVHGLDAALDAARATGATDAFVIGGGEIYAQALPLADVMDLTLIRASFDGDARFPEWDAAAWREVAREPSGQEAPQPLAYDFVTFERRRSA